MKTKEYLTPEAYCAEYYKERNSGSLYFTDSSMKTFCNRYTNIVFELLNTTKKRLLKEGMIELSRKFRSYECQIWDGKKINIDHLN